MSNRLPDSVYDCKDPQHAPRVRPGGPCPTCVSKYISDDVRNCKIPGHRKPERPGGPCPTCIRIDWDPRKPRPSIGEIARILNRREPFSGPPPKGESDEYS